MSTSNNTAADHHDDVLAVGPSNSCNTPAPSNEQQQCRAAAAYGTDPLTDRTPLLPPPSRSLGHRSHTHDGSDDDHHHGHRGGRGGRGGGGGGGRGGRGGLFRTLFGHFATHALDVHIPNILIGISASVELPLIMILGRAIGAPHSQIAEFVTISSICRTSLDIPFGIFVEVIGVKEVMLVSLLLNVAASYLGFVVSNEHELFLFCALSGISLGGFFLSRHIFVGGITRRKQRGVLMAVLSGLLRWSHVIGPVATGLITSYTGSVRNAFFLSLATSAVAFASILLDTVCFREKNRRAAAREQRQLRKYEAAAERLEASMSLRASFGGGGRTSLHHGIEMCPTTSLVNNPNNPLSPPSALSPRRPSEDGGEGGSTAGSGDHVAINADPTIADLYSRSTADSYSPTEGIDPADPCHAIIKGQGRGGAAAAGTHASHGSGSNGDGGGGGHAVVMPPPAAFPMSPLSASFQAGGVGGGHHNAFPAHHQGPAAATATAAVVPVTAGSPSAAVHRAASSTNNTPHPRHHHHPHHPHHPHTPMVQKVSVSMGRRQHRRLIIERRVYGGALSPYAAAEFVPPPPLTSSQQRIGYIRRLEAADRRRRRLQNSNQQHRAKRHQHGVAMAKGEGEGEPASNPNLALSNTTTATACSSGTTVTTTSADMDSQATLPSPATPAAVIPHPHPHHDSFSLAVLWHTLVAYWPAIWRLGFYIVSLGALRSNRKLMVTMAGMGAGMSDAEVAYLLSFGFIFDALFFPLGGIVLDVFGRRVASVCVVLAFATVFAILPYAADADSLSIVKAVEEYFAAHVRSAEASPSSSSSWWVRYVPSALTSPSPHMFLYGASSLFGFADAFGCGLVMTLVADNAPQQFPAPFYGIMRTIADLGHVVGAGGVSLMLRYLTFQHTCWVLVGQGVFTALWGYGVLRHADEEEEDDEHSVHGCGDDDEWVDEEAEAEETTDDEDSHHHRKHHHRHHGHGHSHGRHHHRDDGVLLVGSLHVAAGDTVEAPKGREGAEASAQSGANGGGGGYGAC